MFSAPWTQIGSLQSDVESIKQTLHGKVDDHELRSAKSSLDRVENSLREIRTEVDGLCSRVQALEDAHVHDETCGH